MRKQFTIASAFAVAALVGTSSLAFAGPLETVGPSGSGATHTLISDAINAVDNNGVVEIIDAGTTDTVSGFIELGDGPENYTIRKEASLGTVNVTGTSSDGGVMVLRNLTSNKNVTIEGVIITRAGGSGAVIDIDQDLTFTIDVTFNDCTVQHEGTAGGDHGEALKLDDGFNGGAQVTINANDTNFTALGPGGDSKATIRVQDTTWQNLEVNLTDCVVTNENYRAIKNDGGDNQVWNLLRTSVTSPNNRNFQMDDPHSNCTFTIVDSILSGGEEAIHCDEDGTTSLNNSWTISGSLIETTGTSDNTIRITLDDFNEFNLSNSVIIVADNVSNSSSRGVNLQGFASGGTGDQGIFIYNNTFLAPGASTAGGRAISGSGMEINAWNNLFLNFGDAALLSGSYSTALAYDSDNNIIVGPADDTSRGSNGAYISAAAGIGNALTAAGLDVDYKPLTGSAVLAAGGTTNTSNVAGKNDILAFIGNVDKDGVTREATPDVGAFELDSSSAVSDWTNY